MTSMADNRPRIITVICIIGFAGVLFTIPLVFSEPAKHLGPWYQSYLALSAGIGLVCMTGLWMMKKWGLVAYAALAGISQLVLMYLGVWSVTALVIPAIVIAICFPKYKLMN